MNIIISSTNIQNVSNFSSYIGLWCSLVLAKTSSLIFYMEDNGNLSSSQFKEKLKFYRYVQQLYIRAKLLFVNAFKKLCCCCSITKSCPALCDPMNCSTSFPILHYLPEFAQTRDHWVSDTIQPSHPLSSPFPPTFNLSQHQGLFQWVSSLHQVVKVLEFQLQYQSFQWIFRTDSFRMHWLDLLAVQGTLKSLQHYSSKASVLQPSTFFVVRLSLPYMTTGKAIVLAKWTFVGKVMSLLFNMLSRLFKAFLPRSNHLLITWLQSPSAVILELPKRKNVTVSIVSPSICHNVMGPDAMILIFWKLSFKPSFSLYSFTFIKRLFSYSSLSARRVVSSAYLRLLVFLPTVFIPACASSNPTFLMMYSAYKLNKQGDNIQPWCTPFLIWNQSVVPCQVLTVASWPAYRFLKRQVRWSGIPTSWRIFNSLLWSTQLRLWYNQ